MIFSEKFFLHYFCFPTTLTIARRSGKIVAHQNQYRNIQWCENRRRYTIHLSSRTYRRKTVEGTDLLPEKWDDCSRRIAGKTGKRWLNQHNQVENVPRTLGHVFAAQEGKCKGKFHEDISSMSGTFFQAVFSNGTDRQNHGGEATGMENFHAGYRVCDE